MRPNRLKLIICLFLIVSTISVFWRIRNHDFVNYDDKTYVSENRHVQAGLTWEGAMWAFTTTHASNWHPLTWLSHMLDCQIYGLNVGGHHLTNLLFHIANTLLLFLILNRMTGALWRSAFVAALFALHPLHVESVAWVAERKDVLSAFFWMLTMWAYIRYAEHPGIKTYLLVLLFFALGLMSKPMLVTLPFVLLLMDYWPLGRLRLRQLNENRALKIKETRVVRLILEKIPLLVLAAVSSAVTFYAQIGTVAPLDKLSLSIRTANALVSYVSYIGKMIWPDRLAMFYPHEGMPSEWRVIGACLLLAGITVFVIRAARRFPYLPTGWLWYLGTLVPVIGIVQVGAQSMADRYTYVPLIGLFIIIAWGVADLSSRWRHKRQILVICTAAVLLALAIGTWSQGRYWRNSVTLFTRALDVTTNNYVAHHNLGRVLADQGKIDEAISHYSRALQIKSSLPEAHNNLGAILADQGRFKGAINHYFEALRLRPESEGVRNNLGVCYFKLGRIDEAIVEFKTAIKIDPDHADAHYNLGVAYGSKGRPDLAFKEMRIAKELSARKKWQEVVKGVKGSMPHKR